MTTATQRWVEHAKLGGWSSFHEVGSKIELAEALLNPLAWQATGKTRGWGLICTECLTEGGERTSCSCGMSYPPTDYKWHWSWHRFIDALADGKDIEQALLAIE